MVINLKNISKNTEDALYKFISDKYGYKKKGTVSKTVEDAIDFFIENQDLFENWEKEKKLRIKTIKNSFEF